MNKDESNQALLDKGQVILTVKLHTVEDAEQLLTWLYTNKSPMSAELCEISWDKVTVSKDDASIIDLIKKLYPQR